jgi:hypothetical protein
VQLIIWVNAVPPLAEQTNGFSGAELRAIVGEVLRRVAQQQASMQGAIEIKVDIFKQVLSVYQPPPEQRFILDQHAPHLLWRGSKNQSLHLL